MTLLIRVRAVWERVRSSLWFLPAVAVLTAIGVGSFLAEGPLPPLLRDLTFVGSPEGARAILSTVAGSTITVTGLTFSLTVVALQGAASQFSPRLLRTFLADRGNQIVLSGFLATFAYSLAVLRSIRGGPDPATAEIPQFAVAVAFGLTLMSVALLVYFFHHLTQQLRVETVLREVQDDILALLARRKSTQVEAELPVVPEAASRVRALRSGYVQEVQVATLATAARAAGVVVCMRAAVGSHVTEGTTLAWVWADDGTDIDEDDDERRSELEEAVHGGIQIGFERTLQQDVALGIRGLVDIATKALSPGVNDPTTAVNTIAALSVVVCRLAGHDLGPTVVRDEDEDEDEDGAGPVRAAAPFPTFREFLALVCDQPRRYGATEPAVLGELLRLLGDTVEVNDSDEVRDAVARQIEGTEEVIDRVSFTAVERERLESSVRHARAALRGGRRLAAVNGESAQPAE